MRKTCFKAWRRRRCDFWVYLIDKKILKNGKRTKKPL
jgi:hypothetical protein